MKEVIAATIIIATIFSAMAITVVHVDDMPWVSDKILERVAREETRCATSPNANIDACTQVVRQMKAVTSALAAALLTIAAAMSSPGRATASFGILAGVVAIKAAYHQTMHITNGDLTLPIIILGSAVLLTVAIASGAIIAMLRERRANKAN